MSNFTEENFADDSIDELKNRIMQTEIKNALQFSASRVPKFNLKVYVLFMICQSIFQIVTYSLKLSPQVRFLLMFIA